MLSNSDKKKLGAVVGGVVVVTGMAFGILRMNKTPERIVDEGQSGQSLSFPVGSESLSSELIAQVGSGESGRSPVSAYRETRLPEGSSSEAQPNEANLNVRPGQTSGTSSSGQGTSAKEPASDAAGTSGKNSESKATNSEAIPEKPAQRSENEPSENGSSETSTSASAGASSATEHRASEAGTSDESSSSVKNPEEKPVVATVVTKAINEKSVYEKQSLGDRSITFYQHPALSVGLDLRNELELAKQLFVEPVSDGFVIFPRPLLSALGMNADSLKKYLEEKKTIPGSVTVTRVDAKKQEELEKADKDKKMRFVPAEGGTFYAISSVPDSDGKYSGFYAMLEKPLNPDLISANLSTAGMIGDPVQPKTGETVGNVQSEWASLVEQMRQNPAVSEYHLNLPLLASADAYMKDGKDIRANVPEGEPTYSFGRYDLNGDQTPEYMIRAQIDGAKAGTVGGYWAILEPTPSGLQVVNVIPEGNGDLIRKDDRIILPALVASEKGLTLSLNEMKLGETSVNPSLPDVLFEKTGNLTGAELAKKYPEDRLVVIGEAVYRFKMKDFDRFADYALNQMVGAEKLDFIGPMVDGETGEENPDGMQGQKLDDVMTYLQDRYPNLPLSQEKLKKAAPTSTFKDLDRPVDAGDFDRVE